VLARFPFGCPTYDGTVQGVRRRLAAVVVTAVAATVAACGQDASQSASDRGERVFRANCAACHGSDLAGTSLGPSLLGPEQVQLSDEAVRLVIRNGVVDSGGEFAGMPGNSVLRDAQINEIIAYVRNRQQVASSG